MTLRSGGATLGRHTEHLYPRNESRMDRRGYLTSFRGHGGELVLLSKMTDATDRVAFRTTSCQDKEHVHKPVLHGCATGARYRLKKGTVST